MLFCHTIRAYSVVIVLKPYKEGMEYSSRLLSTNGFLIQLCNRMWKSRGLSIRVSDPVVVLPQSCSYMKVYVYKETYLKKYSSMVNFICFNKY